MEYDKPIALGEVRVCWKFLEWRDDGEEYGVLYITYGGKYEEPDLWHVKWIHYLDYLVEYVPPYLERYYSGDLH